MRPAIRASARRRWSSLVSTSMVPLLAATHVQFVAFLEFERIRPAPLAIEPQDYCPILKPASRVSMISISHTCIIRSISRFFKTAFHGKQLLSVPAARLRVVGRSEASLESGLEDAGDTRTPSMPARLLHPCPHLGQFFQPLSICERAIAMSLSWRSSSRCMATRVAWRSWRAITAARKRLMRRRLRASNRGGSPGQRPGGRRSGWWSVWSWLCSSMNGRKPVRLASAFLSEACCQHGGSSASDAKRAAPARAG